MKTYGYRTRERGGFTAGPLKGNQWWNTTDSPKPPVTYSASPSVGKYEIMSDYVHWDFLGRKSKGEFFNNPMSRNVTRRENSTSGPRFTAVVGSTTYWGDLTGPGWTASRLESFAALASRPAPYSIESLIDIARTRCMANVQKPDFEGLVALGELGESLRYLRNPVKTGLQLASSLEKKMLGIQHTRRRTPSDDKVRKNLADLHLEITLGFKPLVKDVFSILEKLRETTPRPQRQTARAKEEHLHTDAWTSTESFSGISYTAKYSYQRYVTIRPWVLYENLMQLSAHEEWGLGLTQLPLTGWQLLPLSFLVDRYANFGDLISAIMPRVGTKRLSHGYSVSVKQTLKREVSGYVFSAAGWSTDRDGTGTDTLIEESYYRVPDIGVPTLAMKDLTALHGDVAHLAQLLSLTTQKLSNLSRGIPPDPKALKLSRAVGAKDIWGKHAHL